MRQAGRAVAGLEQHLVLGVALQALHQFAGFLERPGGGGLGCRAQVAGKIGRIGKDGRGIGHDREAPHTGRNNAVPPVWRTCPI